MIQKRGVGWAGDGDAWSFEVREPPFLSGQLFKRGTDSPRKIIVPRITCPNWGQGWEFYDQVCRAVSIPKALLIDIEGLLDILTTEESAKSYLLSSSLPRTEQQSPKLEIP
jgi:hypothetical protein